MAGLTSVDPVTRVYALTNPVTGQTFYAAPNYSTVNGQVRPSAFNVPSSASDYVINVPAVNAANGSRPPTASEARLIYYAADRQLSLSPLSSNRSSLSAAQRTNANINPSSNYDGSLVSGELKDVHGVYNDRVIISGGFYADGTPIQPISTVHGDSYFDYSHGFREVWDEPPEGVEIIDRTGRQYTQAEIEQIQALEEEYVRRGITDEVPDATNGDFEEGYGDGQVDPRIAEAIREQEARNQQQTGAPTGYDCYPSGGSGGRYDGGNVPVGPQIDGGSGAAATPAELRAIPPEVRRFLTAQELAFALNPTVEGLGQFSGLFSFVGNSIYGRDVMSEGQGLTGVTPAAMGHLILLAKRWTNQGGAPLRIVSAHRTREYNNYLRSIGVGAALNSRHITGDAFDISVTSFEFVRFARSQGFRGIGRYSSFTHIDLGPLRSWGQNSGVSSVPVGTAAAAAEASGLQPTRASDYLAPPPDTLGPS